MSLPSSIHGGVQLKAAASSSATEYDKPGAIKTANMKNMTDKIRQLWGVVLGLNNILASSVNVDVFMFTDVDIVLFLWVYARC